MVSRPGDTRCSKCKSSSDMYLIGACRARQVITVLFILLSMNFSCTHGKKCVCSSKACKEAGMDTCRTRYSCYTELIVNNDGSVRLNTTTRGCTESPTPLLCQTRARPSQANAITSRTSRTDELSPRIRGIRVPWPRLNCCDTHDYCNAESITESAEASLLFPTPTLFQGHTVPSFELETTTQKSHDPSVQISTNDIRNNGYRGSIHSILHGEVKPIHVAVLLLAIAALLSVLAACYVITRFLGGFPGNDLRHTEGQC